VLQVPASLNYSCDNAMAFKRLPIVYFLALMVGSVNAGTHNYGKPLVFSNYIKLIIPCRPDLTGRRTCSLAKASTLVKHYNNSHNTFDQSRDLTQALYL
jgi:hypothetical protein